MATAYRVPLCLSCAFATARSPCTCSFGHRHRVFLPDRLNSHLGALEECGIVAAPVNLPFSPARKIEQDRSTRKAFRTYYGTFEAVTTNSWKVSVLHSDLPVLVEFWASWCGPCRMVDRVIDEIAQEYDGRIKIFKLDTDKHPKVAADHGIERIPTVLLFKNGQKLQSITGTMPKSVYVAAIEKCLGT